MLNSLVFGMKQSCYIRKTAQDFKVNFISGSAEFNLNQTVSGAISEATGTIKTVYVASGAWLSGTAAGYIVVSFLQGVFSGGENISDDGDTPGSATVSGIPERMTDSFGALITTTKDVFSSCSFDDEGGVSSGVRDFSAGPFVVRVPLLFLPSEADIEEGDHVLGLSEGFDELYSVTRVRKPTGIFSASTDHKEAILELIKKNES